MRRFVVFAVLAVLAVPAFALAQAINPSDTTLPSSFGVSTNTDVRLIVINIVRYLLGFLGLLAVIIVLYGGYLWMTAAGNAQQVDQAKQVLKNGLIGLVIILSAFAIVQFVIYSFFNNGNQGDGNLRVNLNPPCLNCWSLGAGIIEDHYPERDARDVPRNVSALITFREDIKVLPDGDANEQDDSFILNAVPRGSSFSSGTCGALWCGDLNPSIFTLVWQNKVDGPADTDAIVYTNDLRTFGIAPKSLLGSADTESRYEATVKGKLTDAGPGLTKEDQTDGKAAMNSDYVWNFEVSTKVDTTPPVITDIVPYDQDITSRSSVVLITFSEAVNPISATGRSADGFNNITIVDRAAPSTPISGRYRLGNGYRTVTFLTDTKCGTNACGEDMFCLKENTQFDAVVKAATLWSTAAPCSAPIADPTNNASRACSPINGLLFDGVVDAAGNSFDGTKTGTGTLKLPTGNDKAEGQPTDNFAWSFATDDTIVNIGPEIVQQTETGVSGVSPVPDAAAIERADPLKAQFNRAMLPFSAFTDPTNPKGAPLPPVKVYAVNKVTSEIIEPSVGPIWTRQDRVKVCSLQRTRSCSLNSDCGRCETSGIDCSAASPCAGGQRCVVGLNFCGQESVRVNHSEFAINQGYEARIGNGIKDFTQNCFEPPKGPLPNSQCSTADPSNLCPAVTY